MKLRRLEKRMAPKTMQLITAGGEDEGNSDSDDESDVETVLM
jgi:hypothetical protein